MTPLQKREQLIKLFGAYSKRLEEVFDDYYNGLCRVFNEGYVERWIKSDDPLFAFEGFPSLTAKVDNIFSDFVNKQMATIRTSISDGVALAFTHDSDLLSGFSVMSDIAVGTARKSALDAFLRTRMKPTSGLSLSQLVWNYASQAKSEFEVAISNIIGEGLKKGTSAEELGRMVRGELRNPDMMYRRYHEKVILSDSTKKDVAIWRRRVVDENGKVRFVKEPLEKVGMGHYRSARKNALRLMRTEINAAYHSANYDRWQQEPFVIGIRIFLSPQHPAPDECDELQGNYPKDFYWAGWHPQCYSDDTKVLTSAGWKLFADVKDNDLILSLNPDTRELEYVSIVAKQKWWKSGTMIRFKNSGLDCLVTPEHRMVYIDNGSGRINYCSALEFASSQGSLFSRLDTFNAFYKEYVIYSGYVYDLTLERNHIMYVQRNGRCYWGSNCMCASAPITLQGEEKKEYYRRLAEGEDMSDYESPNGIYDVPDNYKKYVAKHAAKIERADRRGKLAWHLQANRPYWEDIVDEALKNDEVFVTEQSDNDIATLRNLDDRIETWLINNYDQYSRLTDEEQTKTKQFIRDLLDESDYGMVVPFKDFNGNDVIDAIFSSYFKNQIETGTGQGIVSKSRRTARSNMLFGTDEVNTAPEEYEKYGMLFYRDILKQAGSGFGSGYLYPGGDGMHVRFKKDKVRCTFCFGDSFRCTAVSRTDDIQYSCGSYSGVRALVDLPKEWESGKYATKLDLAQRVKGYIELQYHGKLTLDCIESVYIPQHTLRQLQPATFDKIKKVGCTVYTTDADRKLITL